MESRITSAPIDPKMKAKVGGPGAVDADAQARAEPVIADMAGDYLEWAEEDLLNMEDALDKLKAAETKDRKEHIEDIFQLSYNVKGQGGSFKYDMMTRIGEQHVGVL